MHTYLIASGCISRGENSSPCEGGGADAGEGEGQANPWRALFDPHRKKLSGAWDYLVENKDLPYYLAKRLVTAADTANLWSAMQRTS